MNDISTRKYLQIIDNLDVPPITKSLARDYIKNLEDFDSVATLNTTMNRQYFVFSVFNLIGTDFISFLKYDLWQDSFINLAKQNLKHSSGSKKNEMFKNIYYLFKNSEELNLTLEENKKLFKEFFILAVNLNNKSEEQSVVSVMYDLFKNKEIIGVDFFKEIFAIYLENIKTDKKFLPRVNLIKAWGETEDFSEQAKTYKNIRNFFDKSTDEKVFNTSVKKYFLHEISKNKKIGITTVIKNFNAINEFLKLKLDGNSNIENFIALDEKIFHKILIVFEKRDFMVEAAIKFHGLFFDEIRRNSNDVQYQLMKDVWEKLLFKCQLESELVSKGAKKSTKKI